MQYETIDAFLADVPPDKRKALQSLRRMIRKAAPRAKEGFSYGLPAFRYAGRPLVAFAAAKGHCGFYVMSPKVMEAHAAKLKGRDVSKGTIRFTPDKPLPASLVSSVVKARMKEIDG
jgi:uncharacterized protein YdhG (YjbR/CyaY superfamily)